MVMDEAGRNGLKWHLAQQITYHVTLYIFQQITHHVIMRILSITTIHRTCNQTTYHAIINDNIPTTIHTPCNSIITQIWGDFYFSYKYQKFSPVSNYNNLQFVNK